MRMRMHRVGVMIRWSRLQPAVARWQAEACSTKDALWISYPKSSLLHLRALRVFVVHLSYLLKLANADVMAAGADDGAARDGEARADGAQVGAVAGLADADLHVFHGLDVRHAQQE